MNLPSDVLIEIMGLSLETMCDWSKLQRVSKQWRECCRKPRAVAFLTPQLEHLPRLGPLCAMVRSVEHFLTDFEHLEAWSDLQVLHSVPLLSGLFVNARLVDWARVARIPKLRKLHIWNCDQDLDGLFSVGRCSGLHDLEIHKCSQFNKRSLSLLTNLEHLERLSLQKVNIQSKDLHVLASFSRLTHLELTDCPLIYSVECLSSLTQLRSLSLSGCGFIQNLRPVRGLLHLKVLNLDRCWGLKSRQNLEHLHSLWNLEVFSASMWFDSEGLSILMQWPHLKQVTLRDCKFDGRAKKAFVAWCGKRKVKFAL
jgi:hypothetical protein